MRLFPWMRNPTEISLYVGILMQIPPQVGESSGPGGTRTRVYFSAIDTQVGEKGEKTVHYVYFVPKSPYCSNISVPKLFPKCAPICIGMKQGKATSSPVLRGSSCKRVHCADKSDKE
jgi:hypothetical protein